MRVLVAGGAGFIGSNLCARLLADGHEVLCLDSLITGSRGNLARLEGRGGFAYRQHDVTRPLPDDVGTHEAVFHLASPASPPGYLRKPLETALVNSQGTNNLLAAAKGWGARFLMASTSEAYGDPLEHPQKETYWGNVNPNGERSCYDESKRFAEAITFVYWRTYGLDARIIRIFNTYGPQSDPADGRVVPNFISQALRGDPITLYGTGEQTRSLCYVDDLVEGINRAMFREGTTGEVFNLGNPDERTVRELAEVINELCGGRSELVYRPHISADDPQRRCPDIGKARQRLGWEPKVELRDGLGRTIEWFRERIGVGAAAHG